MPATWALVEARRRLSQGSRPWPHRLRRTPSRLLRRSLPTTAERFVLFGGYGSRVPCRPGRAVYYEDAYIYEQGIANSPHFPPEFIPALRASLVGIPPRVVLQKLGVLDGFPTIVTHATSWSPSPDHAGDCDPAHTFAIETRPKASSIPGELTWLTWLPDIGISGNGHLVTARLTAIRFSRSYGADRRADVDRVKLAWSRAPV